MISTFLFRASITSAKISSCSTPKPHPKESPRRRMRWRPGVFSAGYSMSRRPSEFSATSTEKSMDSIRPLASGRPDQPSRGS